MDDTSLTAPDTLQPSLTPLAFPEGFTPGQYASFDVSPEPMYGPDDLPEDFKAAIDDLTEVVSRADSAARIWEVMQAWEARMFERNYQFLSAGWKGWGMYGTVNGSKASGQEIMQSQNNGRMFSVNVYGARCDKIVAALSRKVPGLTFVPKRTEATQDQTAAEESKKYLKVWMNDAGIKDCTVSIAYLFYTDETAIAFTRSVADEQAWGTEPEERPHPYFGSPEPDGLTPETELESVPMGREVPAIRELTEIDGKLEWKRPIYTDRFEDMGWIRRAKEYNVNLLRERYPWIEEKINAGGSVGGNDQLDRQARINVRLAVQTSSSSGESWQQDATETITWFRPSQYRAIEKKEIRQQFYRLFPKGLRVTHAGGELAFIRNESMNDHVHIFHAKKGSGQNRRAIGTNYLPIQKILNANISLIDRYFRACVPRRYGVEPYVDVQAINAQANDPAKLTPVTQLPTGMKAGDVVGVEQVPQPTSGMFEFIQWCIDGAPEAMDGATTAMFGTEDTDTYGAAKLNRDQSLQVYSMPWGNICTGLARCAEQAVTAASDNRVASIQSNIPGAGRLQVELENLKGNALCYPESMEIPQTIAEQEAQTAELLENGQNVALYQSIVNDPSNLPIFANFPSLNGFSIDGLDDVRAQEGEFELLMQSGPIDNPQLQQAQQLLMEAESSPEAITPEGQQMVVQLQAQLQQIPPLVSSVPVAQNGSENHMIHARITYKKMNSSEGRKLKFGTPEQRAIYQNLELHWQEHVEMSGKLTPPKPIEIKGSVTIDPTKLPPDAQSKAWQAIGLEVSPEELADSHELVPREVTTEKEGVDARGVPIKQKISMVNPAGKLPN